MAGLPVEINPLFLASSGAYTVGRSLRFRSSASAYLNRTFTTPTNNKIWSWSGWIKRGSLGVTSYILEGYPATAGNANDRTQFYFTSGDALEYSTITGGSVTEQLTTTQVFRDPSAWYHITIVLDTTQATSSNRLKFYVNGVQITTFSTATYPALNANPYINSAKVHYSGAAYNGSLVAGTYFDGYQAEVNFIDGQALTPSSFGAYDTNGVWQPKKYTGTYGTNGFYLPFSNTTSTTTLVADSSGNGNNWTPNNISLTAGTTYDSMIDSPTVSASASNYAVLNPLLPVSVTGYAISNANMTFASTNVTSSAPTMNLPTTGKWYWEATLSAGTAANLGIYDTTYQLVAGSNPGTISYGYAYENSTGNKLNNNVYTAYGATYTTNDIIGVAFDSGAGTLIFYKNGASQGTAFTGLTGKIYSAFFAVSISTWNVNFGQRPFAYTAPSGYVALNTYNLPAPSIANGAQYMAATTYTGNGGTLTVNNGTNNTINKTFQPDFIWIKYRNSVSNWAVVDSVRGVNKQVSSSLTNAEVTTTDGITAFNSNGFTLGANTTGYDTNTNTGPYIGYQWLAGGGTGVTNTSGTITSTVSANPTAGFSVATFTSPGGSAQTIGHGLGVAPNMIIMKSRNNVSGWTVYHSSVGNTGSLNLSATTATSTSIDWWNNTSPTSSVWTIGANTNISSWTWVAYCFAAVSGYSAFGSFNGNGSADGPFSYVGFRPRWVMIKRTDSTGNWFMFDTSRDTYNVAIQELYANLSNAEAAGSTDLDILSNGFKLRAASAGINASGGTYIYAAFSENPFQISRAR
jgi:hypothetical protein